MNEGFIVKYSDIYKLEQKYKSNLDELMTNIDSTSEIVAYIINDENFTGATALSVKNYLSDVHITLLASMKTLAQNMLDNFAIYKASYFSVDNSTNFILSEDLMNAYKTSLNQRLNSVLDSEEIINAAIDSIRDLYSCTKPSTATIETSHSGMNTEINTLISDTTTLESTTVQTLEQSSGQLLTLLQQSIAAAGVTSKNIKAYQPNTFFQNQSVYNLANASQYYFEIHEENKDTFDEIWSIEDQLAQEAKDRETEGIWKTIGGVVLVGVGAVCIVFTAGAATPIVAAGLFAGLGTITFGVADSVEGASDIYFGSVGDLDSKSINSLRDKLFMGNTTAYSVTENVFSFAASALVPIGAAANAGTLTFRSGSVAVGKLAVSSVAGAGASKVTMDITGSRTLSMIAGIGISSATGSGLNKLDIKNGWSYNPSEVARNWQGSGLYPGVDGYENIYLKKGEKIYILESDYEVMNNKHSGYATTPEAVVNCNYDSTVLSEGLQIKPYYNDSGEILPPYAEYRSQVTEYTVNKRLLATGYSEKTLANPQFGEGGLPQYFIEDIETEIANGGLTRGDSIPLNNYQISPEKYYNMVNNVSK